MEKLSLGYKYCNIINRFFWFSFSYTYLTFIEQYGFRSSYSNTYHASHLLYLRLYVVQNALHITECSFIFLREIVFLYLLLFFPGNINGLCAIYSICGLRCNAVHCCQGTLLASRVFELFCFMGAYYEILQLILLSYISCQPTLLSIVNCLFFFPSRFLFSSINFLFLFSLIFYFLIFLFFNILFFLHSMLKWNAEKIKCIRFCS